MTERIDTKAVLADCLPPNPANYKSDFLCMTKALLQLETVRAALAQEIADRKADRARIEALEKRLERAEELLRRSGGMTTGEWNDAVAAVLWNPPPAALRSEEET